MRSDPPSGPPDASYRRPPHNSRFLIVIIVGMATVVGLQYTSHPLFGPGKTATLWGMLTGLFLGGFSVWLAQKALAMSTKLSDRCDAFCCDTVGHERERFRR